MKRRTRSWKGRAAAWVAVGLCFGLVMSVATAWIQGVRGCLNGTMPNPEYLRLNGLPGLGDGLSGKAFRLDNCITAVVARGGGWTSDDSSTASPADPALPHWALQPPALSPNAVAGYAKPWGACITSGFGWPFVSLRSYLVYELEENSSTSGMSRGDRTRITEIQSSGLSVNWDSPGTTSSRVNRVVPVNPYWPGLLADIGLWSLLVPITALTFSLLRHVQRRRRGLCVSCGYDLAGVTNAICPECGSHRCTLARPTADIARAQTSGPGSG